MELLTQPWVQHIGWTLIQFLWQGTLISVLFAVVRGLVGRSLTARARYRLACVTLSLMVAAPVATFLVTPGAVAAPLTSWPLPSPDAWQQVLPWLVAGWFSGVIAFSIRLIAGWRVTARLRSDGVRPAPAEWQETLEALVRRIGVSRPVQLLVSSLVEVPTVVGWLRPVVLVPVGALTGLPPGHVRALLAHELAHIWRADYVVNILQSIAEAVLFYHPAVWWVSDQIRMERELCCDDVAVAASGDVLTYARALAELESYRPAHSSTALAANGGSLLNRIRRLIGQPVSHALPGPGAAGAMSVLWLVGLGALVANGAPVERPAPVKTFFTVPTAVQNAPAPKIPVLSAFLFGPYGPAPQVPQPAPTAANKKIHVEGIVVSVAGPPVPRATLQLVGEGRNDSKTADDTGRFVFDDVAPGRYTLYATRPGFLDGGYGAPSAGAPIPGITLEAGQTLKDLVIRLTPQGVISGQVTNQDRDPVVRATVTLYRSTYVRGRKQMTRAASAQSDDEGNYRVPGLSPGRYYLSVQPAGGGGGGRSGGPGPGAAPPARQAPELAADLTTYYPDVLEAGRATAIDVGAGTRLQRIDVRIRRERVYSIKGTVIANGVPMENGNVTVSRKDESLVIQTTIAGVRQGAFEANGLLPGTYILQSIDTSIAGGGRRGAIASDLSGRTEVTLGSANIEGVVISLTQGILVTGVFRSEEGDYQSFLAANAPPKPSIAEETDNQPGAANAGGGPRIRLTEQTGTNAPMSTPPKADGTFEVIVLWPGTYLIDVSGLPARAYVKSIRFAGQDVTRAPLDLSTGGGNLDVVLAAKAPGMSGILRNDKGEPQSRATVTAWPKSLNLGSPTLGAKSVSTDQNGQFKLADLAPGDYYVAGWEGEPLNSNLIQIPAILTFFASEATAVKLAEGSQASTDAKLISATKIAAQVAKLP